MNDAALREALDKGVRTWIVTGDARLLVDRLVDKIVLWGRQRCGPVQFNLAVVHASEGDAASAFSTARTLPMMADLRVVVLRDLDQAGEETLGALAAYVGEPGASTLFVACGEGFPSVRKGGSNWAARVQKALGPATRWVKLAQKDVSPANFAREHARSLGKELGGPEASTLVAIVGVDLGALAREVEKLATYAGDEPKITEDAIQACSSLLAEAVVWDLTTGIAARKPDLALPALHRLLEAGDSSHRLLGLVVWQLRSALQIVELAATGHGDGEIAATLNLRGDQVGRVLKAVGKSPPSTASVLERVARANQLMNSHRAGDRRVFEGLVLELCR